MLTFTASCSKDPEGLDMTQSPAVEGKYRLETLSASLDDEQQTRTGEPNATTGAVNWSAKDRILIVRTSDYATWQYELVKGANTPIGEFEPIIGGTEASSDDPEFGDLIAVYPVAAAYVDASSKNSRSASTRTGIPRTRTKPLHGKSVFPSWASPRGTRIRPMPLRRTTSRSRTSARPQPITSRSLRRTSSSAS